jgi:hypothetical protein
MLLLGLVMYSSFGGERQWTMLGTDSRLTYNMGSQEKWSTPLSHSSVATGVCSHLHN